MQNHDQEQGIIFPAQETQNKTEYKENKENFHFVLKMQRASKLSWIGLSPPNCPWYSFSCDNKKPRKINSSNDWSDKNGSQHP